VAHFERVNERNPITASASQGGFKPGAALEPDRRFIGFSECDASHLQARRFPVLDNNVEKKIIRIQRPCLRAYG
jgi:hypothetical protein